MNREAAVELLGRLPKAQNEFYAGGSESALRRLLSPDVTRAIPGDNCIAGTYRGFSEAVDYFLRRRRLADHTLQLKLRDVLVGEGDRIAALIDGSATIREVDQGWSTLGLYDATDQHITGC